VIHGRAVAAISPAERLFRNTRESPEGDRPKHVARGDHLMWDADLWAGFGSGRSKQITLLVKGYV
jgi:hypothetical protein